MEAPRFILVFKIPTDTQKNFFEMNRKFRHSPSKRFFSPALYISPHPTVEHPSLSSSCNENTDYLVWGTLCPAQLSLQIVCRKVTDMLPLPSRDPRYRIPIAVVVSKQEASCNTTWAVHSSGTIWKLIAEILCYDCQMVGLQGQRQSAG